MSTRRWKAAGFVVVLIGLALGSSVLGAPGSSAAPPPSLGDVSTTASVYPSFVTLLFSRSEVAAADGVPCAVDDRNVATLEGVVAPFLASLGYAGTGTIQTGTTKQSMSYCTHYGETSAISWDGAGRLAAQHGWHFVSHSATYATNWAKLSPSRIQAETCGSAAILDAHQLPGAHGLFAWPNNAYNDAIQRNYVSTCFAFGRQYSYLPTTRAYALTAPYYQHTKGMNGGACNDPTLPCYSMAVQGNGGHYNLPSAIIARMHTLKPGDWYSIQVYLLVTGKNPVYRTNKIAWDCTSTDPKQHWTNDNERYCWSDFQQIVAAIPPGVVVADPLTVAHLLGRPGY
jgi:hypothetical protein